MLLNNNNFHLFVIISSVIYYFLIKKYRSNVKSNFLFLLNILYVPVVLYIFAYIHSTTKFFNQFKITDDFSSNLSMYPSSVDL